MEKLKKECFTFAPILIMEISSKLISLAVASIVVCRKNNKFDRDEVNIWRPGQTEISTDLLQIDLTSEMFRRFGVRNSCGGRTRLDRFFLESAAGHPEKCEPLQFEKFAFLARGARF